MNCIIIDDDATARLIVRKLISTAPNFNIKKEFDNAIDALKYLNEHNVDCVFLDIHMPTFSGFDFIKTIRDSIKIVLISSDKKFALDAFEFSSVVDYLVKPIVEQRFKKTIQKLNLVNQNTNIELDRVGEPSISVKESDGELYVNIDKKLVKLKYSEILIVKAKRDYINLITATNSFTVHSTLKKIEEKLPSDMFLKIHRSFIINLAKIIDIQDNTVLIGKNVVPVSRSNKSELIQRLNLL